VGRVVDAVAQPAHVGYLAVDGFFDGRARGGGPNRNTLTSRPALARELAATRARGYAIDDEEHATGLRCVAAVVRDENGEPWAAVSLAGPTTRITPDRIPVLGALVRATARELTAALGGYIPDGAAA